MPTRKTDAGDTGSSASQSDLEARRDDFDRDDEPMLISASEQIPSPDSDDPADSFLAEGSVPSDPFAAEPNSDVPAADAPDEASTPDLPEPLVIEATIEEPVLPREAVDDTPDPAPQPPVAPVRAAAEHPVHAASDHDDLHDSDEETGSSFAAKALTALVLLLAGAGIGIWAAPRIAPNLPSGMAPVADWLAPASEKTEADIAALQARLDQGLTELRASVAAVPAPAETTAALDTAVDAVDARLTGEIESLKQSLAGADTEAISQRLAALEAGLQSQAAELGTLKQQLSGAAVTSGEAAAAGIDVYRGELDGVRAEVGALRDQVGAFSARVDQVAAEAGRQIETAQTQVATVEAEARTQLSAADAQANLALVDAALASGQPFKDALDKLAAREGLTIPAALSTAAASGVETPSALRDSFGTAAHEAIRASITAAAAGEGVFARARAFLEAQVASRSLTPQEGVGPDAVLSRMEDRLRQDDLPGALAESAQLPPEATAAMAGWLSAAKLRADAVAGYAELDRALAATN